MNELSGVTSIARQLADARQKLIQTGTRNRLVHTARFARRGKSLDIVDADADDVFSLLAGSGRRLAFAHDPTIRDAADDEEVALLPEATSSSEDGRGVTKLQTRHGREMLAKKLLGLAREAKTLEEEQGINVLYLAIGFLRWFEDPKSEVQREAPLILLPVSLRRNNRTSTYELEPSGGDITTNEPLKHRLHDDFGIILPDIPETEDWSPTSYFDAVTDVIGGQPRWQVDRNGMQLGFFSFAKLLMVKDLEPQNWPQESILRNGLLQGLLRDGFADQTDDFAGFERLDAIFQPGDLIQVVDADASQTIVIETVRRGRNLVVQGPPGTGKSQTITNVIAAAAHDGKSVLFVAEKMAALNVVHDRLKKAGLADVCLELHSRSANKRAVLEELGRTLNAAGEAPGNADASELTDLRDRLNAIAEALHRPIGQTDVTPYRAISTLIRLNEEGFEAPNLSIPGVDAWSRKDLNGALQAAGDLEQIVRVAGTRDSHPLYGIRRTDLLPTDRQRLKPRLDDLVQALEAADKAATAVADGLGLTAPSSSEAVEGMSDVVLHVASLSADAAPFAAAIAAHGGVDRALSIAEVGTHYRLRRESELSVFSAAALSASVDHLRTGLAAGRGFFGRLGSAYRAASAELASLLRQPLPKAQPDRMALLERLLEYQQAALRLRSLDGQASEIFGPLWTGEETDFGALGEAAGWVSRLLQVAVGVNAGRAVELRRHEPEQLRTLSDVVAGRARAATELAAEVVSTLDVDIGSIFGLERLEDVPFRDLKVRVEVWLDNLDRLDEWARLDAADARLREIVGADVPNAVASGTLAPENLLSVIRHCHAEVMYRQFAATQGWLTRLTAKEKSELLGRFQDREKARRGTISRLIRNRHLAGIPRGGMGAMGVIRGEIGKRRAHKPIRRLVSETGAVIQQIKPVFLMSPISVAQFLAPGVLDFDLLVIDEASQVRPEDAIGAIARARQIVVVGDKRQLPPTSFFDRMISDSSEEEADDDVETPAPKAAAATELESILTLCEARGLNGRMLKWHYRSRHPSLIEVSNSVFYSENGGLTLFPSPDATRERDGLTLRRVVGAYDRGGKRHNIIEATEVAKAVAEHARQFPERSLGVVTFSTAQRDRINESLAHLRLTDEDLDAFMREGRAEEFFVKNIENVQGDERDVIFVSVGYGPRIAGTRLDSMAFGPVSAEGGERRLNVLFTRARYRTVAYVSFDPSDIDLARTTRAGARVLKRFLDYAATGSDHQPVVLDADPDSDFEVSVAAEIRRLGYEVDHQVGSAGFKIDLAVHRPHDSGRYMLAVECDGASYHSAVWARERDRLRQEVLEGLRWKFHRVWSTDWFHRREEEVKRLEAALAAAAVERVEAPTSSPKSEQDAVANDEFGEAPQAPLVVDLPDYVVADFTVDSRLEPHAAPVSVLASIVERIIVTEGPVHEEEIARRVSTLFGKQRAGSRVVGAVKNALLILGQRTGGLLSEGGFWMNASQKTSPPLRNRSRAPLTLRKANMLPPIEVAAAVRQVIEHNGAVPYEDLPRAVAVLFGFQRTGPEFRPTMLPIIDAMVARHELVDGPAGLRLAEAE